MGKCKINWKVREKYGIACDWVENVPAIEQILDILPSFKQNVKYVNKKKVKNRCTESFEMTKFAC